MRSTAKAFVLPELPLLWQMNRENIAPTLQMLKQKPVLSKCPMVKVFYRISYFGGLEKMCREFIAFLIFNSTLILITLKQACQTQTTSRAAKALKTA
jgi:hypothetical protein